MDRARERLEQRKELVFLLGEILETLSVVEDRRDNDPYAFRDPTVQQLLFHTIPDIGLALSNLAAEVETMNTVISNLIALLERDPSFRARLSEAKRGSSNRSNPTSQSTSKAPKWPPKGGWPR